LSVWEISRNIGASSYLWILYGTEEGQWSEKREMSGSVPLEVAKAILNSGRDRLAAEKKAALAKGEPWPPLSLRSPALTALTRAHPRSPALTRAHRAHHHPLYRIPSARILVLFDGIGSPLQGGASELHFTYPGVLDPGTPLCKPVIAAWKSCGAPPGNPKPS
jgi:hypothetical protein